MPTLAPLTEGVAWYQPWEGDFLIEEALWDIGWNDSGPGIVPGNNTLLIERGSSATKLDDQTTTLAVNQQLWANNGALSLLSVSSTI